MRDVCSNPVFADARSRVYWDWRVTLAPDGTVRAVEQILDEPYFARLKAGMTKQEVRQTLGRQAESDTQIYPNLGEEVCAWRYLNSAGAYFSMPTSTRKRAG